MIIKKRQKCLFFLSSNKTGSDFTAGLDVLMTQMFFYSLRSFNALSVRISMSAFSFNNSLTNLLSS